MTGEQNNHGVKGHSFHTEVYLLLLRRLSLIPGMSVYWSRSHASLYKQQFTVCLQDSCEGADKRESHGKQPVSHGLMVS